MTEEKFSKAFTAFEWFILEPREYFFSGVRGGIVVFLPCQSSEANASFSMKITSVQEFTERGKLYLPSVFRKNDTSPAPMLFCIRFWL